MGLAMADGGERGLSVERLVAGWGARSSSAWRGGGGGGRATEAGWERLAWTVAGLARFDLACLLWACGRDEPEIRRDVVAVLRLDAAGIECEEGAARSLNGQRAWPRGMLRALVELAVEEMRPQVAAAGLADAQRLQFLRLLAGREGLALPLSAAGWTERWGARYRRVLDAGWKREGAARVWVRQARAGVEAG